MYRWIAKTESSKLMLGYLQYDIYETKSCILNCIFIDAQLWSEDWDNNKTRVKSI